MATFQRTWILVVQMTGKTLWPLSSSSPLLAKYLLWSTVSSALPLENWSRTTCKIRRPLNFCLMTKKSEIWRSLRLSSFNFKLYSILFRKFEYFYIHESFRMRIPKGQKFYGKSEKFNFFDLVQKLWIDQIVLLCKVLITVNK